MPDLPMPSEMKDDVPPAKAEATPPEPAPAKLIVRLFLIPLLIAAAVIGIMLPIGRMAGGPVSLDEALQKLRAHGGERTADFLVGPASKERYKWAKAITDQMKQGMTQDQRVDLADQLDDVLHHFTESSEGEVQNWVLLALGRTWQIDPSQGVFDSPRAGESRRKVLTTLAEYATFDPSQPESKQPRSLVTRKAAVLATAYLSGNPEANAAVPALIAKLSQPGEDADVRLAAATVLGVVASPDDAAAIDALRRAMRSAGEQDKEVAWACAGSLAELDRLDSSAKATLLDLLDRAALAQVQYFDRESDPQNPQMRHLNEAEQQRILINTMQCARRVSDAELQAKLRAAGESDPSPRVREAWLEIKRTLPTTKPQVTND